MAKRNRFIEWAERVEADPHWFYARAVNEEDFKVIEEISAGHGHPLVFMTHPERVLLLLLVAAGMRP